MKPQLQSYKIKSYVAAAFGRLCVETSVLSLVKSCPLAAAFGRLCVETDDSLRIECCACAAAFGRLCVETIYATASLEN